MKMKRADQRMSLTKTNVSSAQPHESDIVWTAA